MKISLSKIRKFPIESYLRNHNIDFEIKTKYYLFDECPSCKKEKKFVLNIDERFYTCFVCPAKGSLISFIQMIDDVDFRTAVSLINENKEYTTSTVLKPIEINEVYNDLDQIVISNMDEIMMPQYFIDVNLRDDSEEAKYLKFRGFTQELVDMFEIKYHPYAKRVIFPIYNHLEALVGWQARDITDLSDVKIITKPEGLRKSLLLYNFDHYKYDSYVTIVEGPVDAIKGYQYNAVAILGKKISKFQVSLLESNPNLKDIYIALDPNAYDEAKALASELSILYNVKIVQNYYGHGDLGECSVDEANFILENATPYESCRDILKGIL